MQIPKKPIPFPLSPKSILEHSKKIEDELARALFSFLYITGARVSEAQRFKRIDIISETTDFLKLSIVTLKRRRPFRRTIPIPIGKYMARCFEEQHWNIVEKYLKESSPNENPFSIWQNMSEYLKRKVPEIETTAMTQDGSTIFYKKKFNPHFLRHSRLTHLADPDIYGFNEFELKEFAGWSDIRMAQRYVHIVGVEKAFRRKMKVLY